jgi:hypothetical protein
MPPIPQEHGLPVYTVYGAHATLKLRQIEKLGMGVKEIVQSLYGDEMNVWPLQSRNWSFNAVMSRGEETVDLPGEVAVQVLEKQLVAPSFNEASRESSEIVANVDKGCRH